MEREHKDRMLEIENQRMINFPQIERVSEMTIEPKQKAENVDKTVQVGTGYTQYLNKDIQVGTYETKQSKTQESKLKQFFGRSNRIGKMIAQAKKS